MPSLKLIKPKFFESKERKEEISVTVDTREQLTLPENNTVDILPDVNTNVIQTRHTFFCHAMKDEEPFSRPVNFPWNLHELTVQQLLDVGYVIVKWDTGKKYSLTLTYKRFPFLEVPVNLRSLLRVFDSIKIKSEHKYYNKDKDPYIIVGMPPTIEMATTVFQTLQFQENMFFTWSFFEHIEKINKEWCQFAEKRMNLNLRHQENVDEWWDKSIYTKRSMMKHQKVGIQAGIDIPQLAFLWEPGAAKTAAAILVIQEKIKRGTIKNAIVVCPGIVREQWKDETISFSDLSPHVIYSNVNDLWKTRHDIYIMSYDRLRISGKEILSYVDDSVMIVLDESTEIKNFSKRTRISLKIGRKITNRMILTGTPVTESLKNIFYQWLFLDGGEEFGYTMKGFTDKYFHTCATSRRLIPNKGAAEAIGEKMFKRSIRYRKDEICDIPPKSYRIIYCAMTEEQQKLYSRVTNQIETEVDKNKIITAPIILVSMLRTMQIVNGHVGITNEETSKSETYILEKNPKADVISQLMNESIDSQIPTIVWGCFRPDIELFAKLLKEKDVTSYSSVQGGMTPKQQCEACSRFQDTKESLFLLANITTLKFGKNLQRCRRVLYFSNPYSLLARGQSEDRAHRIGQKNKVEYIDIIMEDSIDVSIKAAHKSKMDMVSIVNRDNMDAIMRGKVEL